MRKELYLELSMLILMKITLNLPVKIIVYLIDLIKQPKCYRNPINPTCIDLILTNVPRSFDLTCAIEKGQSDFHLMTMTAMRKFFKKFQPNNIQLEDV